MPTLTIQLPGLPPVEHILREEAITLGRMKGNTIALDDGSVSLSHAKITRIGDDYLLKDLNSTNGTMLNGQSINEARLRNGDQLKFGEVVAIFRLEAAKSAAPAAPLAATDLPQAAAHTVTGLIPTQPAAPVLKRQAPPPGPAPRAAAPAVPTPGSTATASSRGAKKNPVVLLAPILGGVSAIAVVGFVIWKIVGGSPDGSASAPAPTPAPKMVAVQSPAQKPPPAAASQRTNAAARTNVASVTSVTNATAPANPVAIEPVAPPPVVPPVTVQTNVPEVQPENPVLADLVKALSSPEVATRRRAAEGISSFEASAKDAVPALRAALKDSDADVRMWSALALVGNQTYDKAAIPILVEALRRESPTVRQAACISLALIPCDAADKVTVVPALTAVATKDNNEEVRKDALTALRIIAPETIRNE